MVESQQDAQWHREVLEFFTRVLDVLHDISDTVHATHLLTQQRTEGSAKVAPEDDDDRLLTVEETAEYLGMTKSQLYNPAWRAKGPKAVRVGRRIRFRKRDLRRWVDSVTGLQVEPDTAREGRVHTPRPQPRPVQAVDVPWCMGSWREPLAAGAIKGSGVCRICKDPYVTLKNDGTLKKHRPYIRPGSR